MSGLDQLRAEAVAARGLDPAAARVVTGTTLAAIEQSADDLARLIREREQPDEGQSEQPGSDFFSRAAADKQRRQSELLDALTGRPRPQPQRDEQGRFASGGFDGGSRTPPPPPAPSHEQTLAWLLVSGAGDVGRDL